jgi:thiol-disulfide isomerase/thioredoxin
MTLLVTIAITTACGGGAAPTADPSPTAGEPDGLPVAPEFRLDDVDGNALTLSDSAGNLRLIDFWATWCPPCVEEMPVFKELHETYAGRGLVIVGLSSDEDVEDVREFVAEHDLPWVNAIAPDELREQYRVLGLPQTVLVDADGRIAKQFNAGVVPKPVLVEWIEKLLPDTPAGDA